jgi:ABC-type transport system involved in multi-copper enzyme maturation permease subunit
MMLSLKKSLTVARYTASEILNSKILLNTLFIGIGLFILTFVAYSFSYGDPSRIALDFGLGMLSLSSVGISIFMGVSLLFDEIENRTIYQIISRPVKRSSFLLGKLLGLSCVLIINILILSIISLILFLGVGGEMSSLIYWTILFTVLEAVLVLIIVTFFSLLTSKVLSVILTLCVYIAGHAISGVKLLTFVESRPYLEKLIDAYQFFLPGFYKLNIKDYLLYKKTLPVEYLMSSTGYAILYSGALICLSVFIFNKKDLN